VEAARPPQPPQQILQSEADMSELITSDVISDNLSLDDIVSQVFLSSSTFSGIPISAGHCFRDACTKSCIIYYYYFYLLFIISGLSYALSIALLISFCSVQRPVWIGWWSEYVKLLYILAEHRIQNTKYGTEYPIQNTETHVLKNNHYPNLSVRTMPFPLSKVRYTHLPWTLFLSLAIYDFSRVSDPH
jgi:hypothetical protein